jgi:hypothetical protein
MKAWLVPPIVLPIGLVVLIVVYAAARALA